MDKQVSACGHLVRRRLRRPTRSVGIPIVDECLRIVGWTYHVPMVSGYTLRHSEAEALLGGPVDCAFIEIDQRTDAVRAGAPFNWCGPWRCLALVPRGTLKSQEVDGSHNHVLSLPPH